MSYFTDEFDTPPLSTAAFLQLPQTALAMDAAEQFLQRWAEHGYLLVSMADDAATHGDAAFRQTRVIAPAMPPEAYWKRNGRFHDWLCEQDQEHLPLRFGSHSTGPTALAWLVPAPTMGEIKAPGYSQSWPLDASIRQQWLLTWARRIGQQQHPAQRFLLQLPGATQPTYWFYRNYLGDIPLTGSLSDRAVTLLASLPRYSTITDDPPEPPLDSGQLYVNDYPLTWGKGQVRSQDHHELSPFWHMSTYY